MLYHSRKLQPCYKAIPASLIQGPLNTQHAHRTERCGHNNANNKAFNYYIEYCLYLNHVANIALFYDMGIVY